MGEWFVGVDAGGSSTHVRLLRRRGKDVRFVGEGKGGSGNVQHVGAEGLVREMLVGFGHALHEAGFLTLSVADGVATNVPNNVRRIVVGAAGVGRPHDVQRVVSAFNRAIPAVPVHVSHDGSIALASGTLHNPGIVVIAGTGSIAWSYDIDKTWRRAGGWGYIIDDVGSAFDIGRRALKRVCRAFDGRMAPTSLQNAIAAKLNVRTPPEFIPVVYNDDRPARRIAALAPVVMEEARYGDEAAKEIIQTATNGLAQLVRAVADRSVLPEPCPVVIVGGLFENEFFVTSFERTLRLPDGRFNVIKPNIDPAAAACYLAMQYDEAGGDFHS